MAESDRDLVARAQGGDQPAFGLLVRKYQQRAYAVALAMIHNPDDARDVAQEAFIKAYRSLERFRGNASFYTWLYRIVVNLSIDHLRKGRRSAKVEYDDRIARPDHGEQRGSSLEPSRLGMDPRRNLARKELADRIAHCVQELSDKHRAVIILREYEGLSYSEMAEALDISKGTVMSRLFHARKKMQACLGEFLGGRDLSI
ncbi:MAG: sigma-70 family RNA polymerase sigma factor [Deltaproteobacteria bacterium]|nr:sigma-70 family RNA polymerase sigma factor [Deltaproteobacteria bacterium]